MGNSLRALLALCAVILISACSRPPSATDSVAIASGAPTLAPATTTAGSPPPSEASSPQDDEEEPPEGPWLLGADNAVTDAIHALDRLHSYRVRATLTSNPPASSFKLRGVVINGDPGRVQEEVTFAEGMTATNVQIGRTTWSSFGGSAFASMDDPAGDFAAPLLNPVQEALAQVAIDLPDIADLGVETKAGIEARHLQSTPKASSFDPKDPDFSALGLFGGTVDVWVSTDDGHLVAAHAEGSIADPFPIGPKGSPEPSSLVVDVVVEGVDDPANRVDEPVVPDPTPRPTGDPRAVALIDGLDDALGALDSYVLRQSGGPTGLDAGMVLKVVAGPPRASDLSVEGLGDQFAIRTIGDKVWVRSKDRWERIDDGLTDCEDEPVPPGDEAFASTCSFSLPTAFTMGLRENDVTFEVVAEDESLDGVPATHLRSVVGLGAGGFSVPGVTDLWIARTGGYPLRSEFVGQGTSTTMTITRINDPDLRIEPPKH